MTVLRCLVLVTLLLNINSFGFIRAQLSSPYAQSLDQAKAANELRIQRQKHLIAESDRLLHSTDLKKRIDNSAPDRLSVDSTQGSRRN